VAATDLVRHPTTKERENFRRDYWKPYLNALEDWIEDLSGEHHVAVRVTERGLQQRNRGRPRKELAK
jgi:N-formylglutamate amidohydrolase